MRRLSNTIGGRAFAAAVIFIFIVSLFGAETALAQGSLYEVTITNLTRDQQFTPILIVTHDASVHLYELGSPASAELESLAETGNTAPLTALLTGTPGVLNIATSGGLLAPGASVTVQVLGGGKFKQFSVASMLIPTNDAFLAVDAADLPRGKREELVLSAPAYDSGTEPNDESCASIPGPFFVECGGPGGGAAPAGGEGYVHVHAGIHGGIGDLDESARDWRNPVASVTVRRVH